MILFLLIWSMRFLPWSLARWTYVLLPLAWRCGWLRDVELIQDQNIQLFGTPGTFEVLAHAGVQKVEIFSEEQGGQRLEVWGKPGGWWRVLVRMHPRASARPAHFSDEEASMIWDQIRPPPIIQPRSLGDDDAS